MVQSLQRRLHPFSSAQEQVDFLESQLPTGLDSFGSKLRDSGFSPFKAKPTEIFQMNLGKMCNQTCKHCHVDAGPDRKEIMAPETMEHCLEAIQKSGIQTVDLTGGAPEMNPHFRWLVEELSAMGKKVIVRCNLTIIVANPKYNDLPEFFRKNGVEVVSSLPYFSKRKTDAQRGDGVFEKSIAALKMLNEVGYGMEGTGLALNLVYNPSGAFLPSGQAGLEKEFKQKLTDGYGISFNSLFAITNLPISRFLEYLEQSGNYVGYMEKLVLAYNPMAVENVMCRTTLSVGWDGKLYDCDFNQMLELEIAPAHSRHIKDIDWQSIDQRNIVIGNHCFGCTAGAGSSCGGEVA